MNPTMTFGAGRESRTRFEVLIEDSFENLEALKLKRQLELEAKQKWKQELVNEILELERQIDEY